MYIIFPGMNCWEQVFGFAIANGVCEIAYYKAIDFFSFAIGYPFPFKTKHDLYWINVRLFSIDASAYVSDHCGTSAINSLRPSDASVRQ